MNGTPVIVDLVSGHEDASLATMFTGKAIVADRVTWLDDGHLALQASSRLLDDQEALLAINTDLSSARTAWVTIDASLHKPGERLKCVYSTDGAQIGAEVSIEARNGLAVSLTVPSVGGFRARVD